MLKVSPILLVVMMVVTYRMVATQLSPKVFTKVVSSMPGDLVNCALDVFHLARPSDHLACAALCHQNPLCLLYCITGNECSLFSAKVTVMWSGDTSTSGFTYDKCFSSWSPTVNDITYVLNNANIESSTALTEGEPQNVFNGFYCFVWRTFCFLGKHSTIPLPWWTADLGTPKTVSTIIITLHQKYYEAFQDVYITLGDSSDFNNNPVFDSYTAGIAAGGVVITFAAPTPLTGRYLKIQTHNSDIALYFCDLLLIG